MSNTNWKNDSMQFPQLIAECEAAGVFDHDLLRELSESMDLSEAEIIEVVIRAKAAWDAIKDDTCIDSPTGVHIPDLSTIQASSDGGEYYLDVNCKHCGRSGCMAGPKTLSDMEVTW